MNLSQSGTPYLTVATKQVASTGRVSTAGNAFHRARQAKVLADGSTTPDKSVRNIRTIDTLIPTFGKMT